MEEEELTEDELLDSVAESQASAPACAKDQPKLPPSEPCKASDVGQVPNMLEASQAVDVPSTPEMCQDDDNKGVFKDSVFYTLVSLAVHVMHCVFGLQDSKPTISLLSVPHGLEEQAAEAAKALEVGSSDNDDLIQAWISHPVLRFALGSEKDASCGQSP